MEDQLQPLLLTTLREWTRLQGGDFVQKCVCMCHRILICDDEPHIALAVGMKFRNAGFEVQTARDGLEAWKLIQLHAPELLISDCTMPRMDGLELCRRIRTLPHLADLPIFLLTARGLELDPYVVRDQLGISKVILKPFSPRELLRDVQGLLGAAATKSGAATA